MTRQVNLNSQQLLAGFGPVQLPAFISTLVVALIAGGLWLYLGWAEQQKLLAEEAQWSATLNSELEQLARFQAEFPNLYNEAELNEQNAELNLRLEKTRETYSGLASQLENAIDGFNAPLQQLADYDVNGLWLSKISLQNGRSQFSVEGFAQVPALIPQYLEQLGRSTFRGISIEQLNVTKETDNNLWRFVMSNQRQVSLPKTNTLSTINTLPATNLLQEAR